MVEMVLKDPHYIIINEIENNQIKHGGMYL